MRLPSSGVLLLLIVVGSVVRLLLAYATFGVPFDIGSYGIVHSALAQDPLQVYSASLEESAGIELQRWPYPPGFFLWIEFAALADSALGLPLHGTVQIPAIAADAALAGLVYQWLGWRRAGERLRLLAGGLVALGPSFAAVSGYHGHIDSLAILPAVAAVIVWQRSDASTRALTAGMLIGVGAAIKTVPLLALLALLPSARSLREALALVAPAVAVPAALLLPFALADPGGVAAILSYSGVPGRAGISLAVQPDLTEFWLQGNTTFSPTPLSETVYQASGTISMLVAAGVGLFLLRFRPAAVDAAVILWLAVFAFAPNLLIHYAVWGLPFFLLAGYIRTVAAAQAALLVPTVIVYLAPWESDAVVPIYIVLMLVLWAVSLFALARLSATIVQGRQKHPHGVQPPL